MVDLGQIIQNYLPSVIAIVAVICGYYGVKTTIKANKENLKETAFFDKELEGITTLNGVIMSILVLHIRTCNSFSNKNFTKKNLSDYNTIMNEWLEDYENTLKELSKYRVFETKDVWGAYLAIENCNDKFVKKYMEIMTKESLEEIKKEMVEVSLMAQREIVDLQNYFENAIRKYRTNKAEFISR